MAADEMRKKIVPENAINPARYQNRYRNITRITALKSRLVPLFTMCLLQLETEYTL